MDCVTRLLLTDWGFESLIETFASHQIDEEALLLLDKESLRMLVPQIGVFLKVEKKIEEYRQLKQNTNEETCPLIYVDYVHDSTATSDSSTTQTPIRTPILQDISNTVNNSNWTSINFDVAAVVFGNCKDIGDKLKLLNNISYLEKLKLSRVLVKHCLVKKCGVFPTTQAKEDLARQIIATFPSLKGLDGTGYEQWFCKGIKDKNSKTTPNRGYLEENLRNWRQRLSATDKIKYGVKTYTKGVARKIHFPTTNPNIEITVENLEKQQWLKENNAPSDVVLRYMSETCVARQEHIIATKPSITQILEAWPKLLEANLIDQDFTLAYSQEKCDSLCREFVVIARSLLVQAKNCGRLSAEKYAVSLLSEMTKLSDSELILSTAEINAALLLLPYLLPQGIVNAKKKFRPTLEQTKRHFIDELPEGSNIEEIINTGRTAEDKSRTQPFVIITGDKCAPIDIHVIVENGAIQAKSLLKAVDICFKLHFLFNVEYSVVCSNVWKFLNSTFYKVDQKDNSLIPSCVKELRARLFV